MDSEPPRFRVVAGLPPYGPLAKSFPQRFEGREGLVVEFLPETSQAWVGNFAPGMGGCDAVHLHPNRTDVVVVHQGEAYVVNPDTREVRDEIEGWILAVRPVNDPDGFVFDRQGIAFERVSAEGLVWHTRRLSWDGFRNVVVGPERITGEAWQPFDSSWIPFEVDLRTGRAKGGSFVEKDAENWERIASEPSN